MDNSEGRFQSLVLHLFGYLLHLYPPRFRDEFSTEIQEIALSRLSESE